MEDITLTEADLNPELISWMDNHIDSRFPTAAAMINAFPKVRPPQKDTLRDRIVMNYPEDVFRIFKEKQYRFYHPSRSVNPSREQEVVVEQLDYPFRSKIQDYMDINDDYAVNSNEYVKDFSIKKLAGTTISHQC